MKALQEYLNLVYPVTIYRAPEGGYVAEIEDLPGCISEGETPDEVLERIENARKVWVEVAFEDGQDIPLPRDEMDYSGKFITRIPKSLHRRISEISKREGVSLNQMVEVLLTTGVSTHSQKTEFSDIKTHLERIEHQLTVNGQNVGFTQPFFDWQATPNLALTENVENIKHPFISEKVRAAA